MVCSFLTVLFRQYGSEISHLKYSSFCNFVHPHDMITFASVSYLQLSLSVRPLHRWTWVWPWTAETCLTLWRMWSGSATACLQLETLWCMAAALTHTQTSRTPCSCSAAPPSTSSTSSYPVSSSPSWLLWGSTCQLTPGRKFPLEWLFSWLSLCFSWWWLRACLHQRVCLL